MRMGMAMEMGLGMGLHWEKLLSSYIFTANINYHMFVKLIIFIASLVLVKFVYFKKYYLNKSLNILFI